MPFRGVSMQDQRAAFVAMAGTAGANVRAACRYFGISPTTGYKWLARAAAGDLADHSRRPRSSPGTSLEVEARCWLCGGSTPRGVGVRCIIGWPARGWATPGRQHHHRHPASPWADGPRATPT